jgi:hypothetical protein
LRKVQSIQMVWFVSNTDGLAADAMFKEGFGEEPSNVQTNKAFSPSTPFLSQAAGTRDGISSLTQVQPGRVDLIVQPSLDQIGQDGMPDMLELERALSVAEGVAKRLSPKIVSCFRVAMVTNLMRLVPTSDEAAAEIIAHTGLDLAPGGVTDLTVSANRTKPISDHLHMNRLLRFSVLQLQLMSNVAVGFNQGTVPTQITKFGALLALDFNSVPLTRGLSPEEQLSVFGAIADETRIFQSSDRVIRCLA